LKACAVPNTGIEARPQRSRTIGGMAASPDAGLAGSNSALACALPGRWSRRLAVESLLGILTVGAYLLPVPILLALAVRLVSRPASARRPSRPPDDAAARAYPG